jgi:hypothetical protein
LFAACAFHVRWRFQMAKANEANQVNLTEAESVPPTEISK